MTSLVPYLTFRDGNASLAFLTDVLGFEIITKQEGEGESVVHAELKRGTAVIMGGEGNAQTGDAPGLYLVVDDVDALYERAIDAGAIVGYPPEDTEWGTRRARFKDLDGHDWSIGTNQPGQQW
jgi:uncharacterized glyoxalase superfamily protein PhnB